MAKALGRTTPTLPVVLSDGQAAGRMSGEYGRPANDVRTSSRPPTPTPAGPSDVETADLPQRVVRNPAIVEAALRDGKLPGRLERDYVVMDELGRGGMGTVYRARDRRLGRAVAIKLLRRTSGRQLRRFVVEAQVAAQLEHPNILPFYGIVVNEKGVPAHAMRLIDGPSFADFLEHCATTKDRSHSAMWQLGGRLEIFLKVCDAIDYAHARGVVHRDLKPENVMLGAHNEVYVTDWGVAKVLAPVGDASTLLTDTIETGPPEFLELESGEVVSRAITKDTVAGDIVGSLAYMAPEQARGLAAEPASDQYALGLLLQEIFTLAPAREGVLAQTQLSNALANERRPMVHKFGLPIPAAAVAIVARATAMRPEDRYPDVRALAEDVRRLVRDEEVSALPDSRVGSVWRRLKKRPLFVLAVVLGLVMVSAALMLTNLQRQLVDRKRAARQSDRLSTLTGRVAETARSLEARFADIEDLVSSLGASTSELRRAAPTSAGRAYTTKDLAAELVPTAWSDRYAQRITFQHPVTVLAPAATGKELALDLQRVGDFERVLIHTTARSSSADDVLASSLEAKVERARAGARIMWSAIGLESGLLAIYPGSAFFPDDYDVRKRSWYRVAAHQKGKVWGEPYPGASSGSLNVSCSVPLYDGAGKFFGVAAALLAIEDLLPETRVDVAGFRTSSILNARGDVVFSSDAKVLRMAPGTYENRKIKLNPFDMEQVRAAVARGEKSGRVTEGRKLATFVRLHALDWTLVVTTDAAPYEFEER